jgi:hypothetical protein
MENSNEVTQILAQLEQQVEQQLAKAIAIFQPLTEQELNKQQTPDEWSIAQCLWHLNSYGYFYLPLIKDAINKKGTTKLPFNSGWLGGYFTGMMNPTTGKKRFKAFKNHRPPAIQDAHAEVAIFINQQETLLLYIRKAANADLNQRIPISISTLVKLKLGDVFGFMVAHIERHMQQAQRYISAK